MSKIVGSLTISPNQSTPLTSTDLRELSQLSEVTGDVNIVLAPSLTRLDALHALTKIGGSLKLNGLSSLTDMSGLALTNLGGLIVNSASALTAIDGVGAVTSLDVEGLQLTNNPVLANIGAFSSLRSAQQLRLQSNPLLTSLQSMRGVAFASTLFVVGMPGLTTLDDLTGLNQSAPLTIVISGNPNLSDFSIFSTLLHLHSLTLDSPLLTSLSDLQQLQTIDSDGQLTVSGPLVARIVLPSLAHAGSISASIDNLPKLTTISFASLENGDVFVTGSSCASGRTIAVELPVLTQANNFQVGVGSTAQPCSITVDAPKLSSVLLNVNFSAGVSSVNLGADLTAKAITFDATRLQSIGLPVVHLERLVISGNQQLTSVGGTGSVTSQIVINSNANLSTQVATLFANGFNPHGTITISGNKIP